MAYHSPIVYEHVQRISGAGRWGEYEREWRSVRGPASAPPCSVSPGSSPGSGLSGCTTFNHTRPADVEWAEPLKAQRLDRLLRDLDHIDQNGQASGAALHTVLLYLLVQSGPRDFMSLVHHLVSDTLGSTTDV